MPLFLHHLFQPSWELMVLKFKPFKILTSSTEVNTGTNSCFQFQNDSWSAKIRSYISTLKLKIVETLQLYDNKMCSLLIMSYNDALMHGSGKEY